MNGSFCQDADLNEQAVTLWPVKYKEEIAASYSTKERLLRLLHAVLQANVQGERPGAGGDFGTQATVTSPRRIYWWSVAGRRAVRTWTLPMDGQLPIFDSIQQRRSIMLSFMGAN